MRLFSENIKLVHRPIVNRHLDWLKQERFYTLHDFQYDVMDKLTIFISISVIIIILGFLISPVLPLGFGIIILYLLWAETGGMSYGNPYKKKMIEEGRWALSKSAHSPIHDSNNKHMKPDNTYFVVAILGFGNIIYGIVLFVLI